VTREKHPRIVMVHEYRFPVDEYLYTLPAGLIDPGETPGQAAVREMKEETGFAFTEYTGGEGSLRRPFFLAPGFSDEPGSAVFGTVEVPGGKALDPCGISSGGVCVHAPGEPLRFSGSFGRGSRKYLNP
jgi:ADP-ribose pyrophosphatase